MTKKISALTNMNGAASIDRAADMLEVSDISGNASYKATPNFILGFSGGNPVSTSDSQTLSNKTLGNTNIITVRDDRFTMQDSADTTKQVVFELSGITTATTRTLTLPNANDTLVGKATTDTLTNKTISGGAVNNATIDNPVLQTDTVSEHTAANGVTVDGMNIKDGKLNTNNSVVTANLTDAAVTPAKLIAGAGTSWTWQSWVPTWTNLTISSSTVDARYIQVGKTIFFEMSITGAGAFDITGTPVYFTLPVATNANVGTTDVLGWGNAQDNSAGGFFALQVWRGDTTSKGRLMCHAVATYLTVRDIDTAVPFDWTQPDSIQIRGFYEAV